MGHFIMERWGSIFEALFSYVGKRIFLKNQINKIELISNKIMISTKNGKVFHSKKLFA